MIIRNFKARLSEVRAFAFDVDGVCTNSRIIISETGQLLRNSNTRDGYALSVAGKVGFPVAIITGGHMENSLSRFKALGINDVYMAVRDKVAAMDDFCAKHQITPSQVLYMGDDIPDLRVLQHVGFPTCPADAASEVRAVSAYVSSFNGGEGCVRDVIEQVLKLRGLWGTTENAMQ